MIARVSTPERPTMPRFCSHDSKVSVDRQFEGGVIGLGVPGNGVNGVPVDGQAGDLQAVVGHQALDPILLLGGTEDLRWIEEGGTGIRPDGDFNRIEAAFGAVGERILESSAGEKRGHDTQFHDASPDE